LERKYSFKYSGLSEIGIAKENENCIVKITNVKNALHYVFELYAIIMSPNSLN